MSYIKRDKLILISISALIIVGVVNLISTYRYKKQLTNSLKEISSEVSELKLKVNEIDSAYKKDLDEMEKKIDKISDTTDNSLNTMKKDIQKISRGKSVMSKSSKTSTPTRGEFKGNGKLIGEFQLTGYCGCRKCNGKWTGYPTKSGAPMQDGVTVAVDPNVIPLGSKIYIEGYGYRIAQDTGSAVKGNIIDIYHSSHSEAYSVGRQRGKKVYLVN